MSAPARFLGSLARALSTMNLYGEGHPSRARAVEDAYERLVRLQEENARPRFTFMGSEVLYGDRTLRRMESWEWSRRLARAGVQRLEFTDPVGHEDFEAFLIDLHRRTTGAASSAEARHARPTSVRYGSVGLGDEREDEDDARDETRTATISYNLADEAEAVEWVQDEMKREGELHLLEAEAVVNSLAVAMHGDRAFVLPLLRLKEFDQYTTTHALNVATLAMALAERIGLERDEVRRFGLAGLLHDLGKIRVPDEILNKPGRLTDREREVMNSHTVEGARLILEAGHPLDLAAVVAYEHHVRIDGGGYPRFRHERECHRASNLVHVCDVFDALRTKRPYRDPWPLDRVLSYIEERAGSEFDPRFAGPFVRMLRERPDRIAEVPAGGG